jgi:hypothetical protein
MKHATKEMAVEAKLVLEKQLIPRPKWIKSIEIESDSHGYFITTKIKNKQEYKDSNVKIPAIININGFKLKNCIMLLG